MATKPAEKPDDDETTEAPEKGAGGDKLPAEVQKRIDALQADADKWKALSRKHEDRAKETDKLAARIAELEGRDKSDIEKLTERAETSRKEAEAAKAEAAEARAELLRLKVGGAKGLTPAQAARLVGETEEELAADADELVRSFGIGNGKTPPPPARRPSEKLRNPADADDDEPDDEEDTPQKLAAKVRR